MQRVIVIGHSYMSRLAIIRSLGHAGYDVTVIVTMYGAVNTNRPLDCYSKYVSAVFFCNAKDELGLIKILTEHCVRENQKTVIIPDSDWSASIIDSNRNLLCKHFLFPYIGDEILCVKDWMSKQRQKKLAQELGLNVSKATVLSVVDKEIPYLGDIHYPCFTKALTTIGGGKQWFRRCDSEDELRSALLSFSEGKSASILVEDFIEIDKEYAVVGLTDGKNVIIPGVIEFVENCQRHLGIARVGKIRPENGFELLIAKFKEYVLSTHFVGLFDIDFLYSKGKFYFCEMNFRYGGSGYAYTVSGVNLPALFVSMVTSESNYSFSDLHVSNVSIYVNERMMVDDLAVGNITIREYNKAIRAAGIRFIRDSEDPKPEYLFYFVLLKAKIKYLQKRISDRD